METERDERDDGDEYESKYELDYESDCTPNSMGELTPIDDGVVATPNDDFSTTHPTSQQQQNEPGEGGGVLAPLVERMIAEVRHQVAATRLKTSIQLYEWKQALPQLCDEDIRDLVHLYYEHYGGNGEFGTRADVLRLIDRFYPSDDDLPVSRIHMFTTYYRIRFFELFQEICRRDSVFDYQNNTEIQKKLSVILHRIAYADTIRTSMAAALETGSPHFNLKYSHFDNLIAIAEDTKSLSAFQQALLISFQACHERHYVRKEDKIYERQYFDQQFTYSYKHCMSVSEFVYSICDNPITSEHWKIMTDKHDIAKNVVKYMTNSNNQYLPIYQADRHLFAFRTGVYSTKEDRFWPYAEVPPGTMCANYIDADFYDFPDQRNYGQFWPDGQFAQDDQDWWKECECDWFRIPTPNFDKIFRTQWRKAGPGVPPECVVENPEIVLRFNWAFLAHAVLWDVNERDRWQKHYTIVGVAAAGKSLLQGLLKRIYKKEDVGIAASQMEKTFGLAGIYKSLVWMISEMTAGFQMDYADWLSIVTGEDVLIRVKNQLAFPWLWKAPGFSIGNEPAAWTDRKNAYSRRLIYNTFNHVPPEKDTGLEDKCVAELPRIILKMTRAYLGLTNWMAAENIKDLESVWPSYYKQNIENFQTENDAIEAFLTHGLIVLDDAMYMPFMMFKAKFREYRTISGCHNMTIDENTTFSAFRRHGLRITKKPQNRSVFLLLLLFALLNFVVMCREYPIGSGEMKKDRWVEGCDAKEYNARSEHFRCSDEQQQQQQQRRRTPSRPSRTVAELQAAFDTHIRTDQFGARSRIHDNNAGHQRLLEYFHELQAYKYWLHRDGLVQGQEYYDVQVLIEMVEPLCPTTH